jgi:hypothetical protein
VAVAVAVAVEIQALAVLAVQVAAVELVAAMLRLLVLERWVKGLRVVLVLVCPLWSIVQVVAVVVLGVLEAQELHQMAAPAV